MKIYSVLDASMHKRTPSYEHNKEASWLYAELKSHIALLMRTP